LTLHKAMTKRVLRDLGLPTAPFATIDDVGELPALALRYPLFAGFLVAGVHPLSLPPPAQGPVDLLARSLSVVALAWFGQRFLILGADFVESRMSGEQVNLRGARTQLTILRRVSEVAIYLVAAAALLMQFEPVRNLGVSLLASAGVAGLVLGFAAQKSIATLFAGIQLSLTQPVRIGDTVVVEGEYGVIEEITLTYVVLKVWDSRRLVLPMAHFLEKPFQNWSRSAPELLGTVELHADYTTDVGAVRAELARILSNEGRGWWDEKSQSVQVTGASEKSLTLRALVSAANPSDLWDLRCLVREKLVAFLARTPESLPMLRSETATRPALPSGPPR
jgi:small-conductance mechanosensitive channel